MTLLLYSKYILKSHLKSSNLMKRLKETTKGKPIQHIPWVFCLQYWKYFFKQGMSHDMNLMENWVFCIVCGLINMGTEVTLFVSLRSFWPTLLISGSVVDTNSSQGTLSNVLKRYVLVA